MKSILTFLLLIFYLINATSQVPQAFKYQAVARDENGNILANKNVNFSIGIIKGTENGEEVYSEQHACVTNAFGLITFEIGNGTSKTGNFAAIDWSNDHYFVKVEMDINGGNNFKSLGVSQLLSVPYALSAKTAENGFSGNYNDLGNKPLLFDGSWENLTGKPNLSPIAVSGSYNDLINRPVTDGSETKIEAGNNIIVSGTGTSVNPYIIHSAQTHYVGELFGGGIVFYVDRSGGHGLIVSMVDLGTEIWSYVIDSLGAAHSNTWDGKANTNAIINQPGHTISAAKRCDDYVNADYGTGVFTDWYLPAINELTLLYRNMYEVSKILEGNNSSYKTMFYKPYWSSTEGRNTFAKNWQAYFFNFESFQCSAYEKSMPLVVRAVRAF